MKEDRDSSRYYLEVRNYDLITREKEVELGRLVAEGSKNAKTEFVEANLRLVINIVNREFRSCILPKKDLIQEGNIGLINAVRRFDPERGFKFATFASWWIRASIINYLNNFSLVKLPVHRKKDVNRIVKIARECGVVNMYSCESIAIFTDEFNERYTKKNGKEYVEKDIKEMLDNYSLLFLVSLNLSRSGDCEEVLTDDIEDVDMPCPQDTVAEILIHKEVASLICELREKEQIVVIKRFGLDGEGEHTLKQVGDMLGVTRERIRQIQDDAFWRLRKIMTHLQDEV